jgi:hypothetical protein
MLGLGQVLPVEQTRAPISPPRCVPNGDRSSAIRVHLPSYTDRCLRRIVPVRYAVLDKEHASQRHDEGSPSRLFSAGCGCQPWHVGAEQLAVSHLQPFVVTVRDYMLGRTMFRHGLSVEHPIPRDEYVRGPGTAQRAWRAFRWIDLRLIAVARRPTSPRLANLSAFGSTICAERRWLSADAR